MTNPTLDSLSFIAGPAGQPGKVIGHSGVQNFTFPYTGPAPVFPADLVASEARIIASVQASFPHFTDPAPSFAAVQLSLASVLAGVTKLATQPAAGSMGSIALTQTGGTGGRLWLFWEKSNDADTAPTVTYNGAPVTVNNVQALAP